MTYEQTIKDLCQLLLQLNKADSDSAEDWQRPEDANQLGAYGHIYKAIKALAGDDVLDQWDHLGEPDLSLSDRHVTKPLPAHTDLGGYPIIYLTNENDMLCGSCAGHESDEVTPLVHYEGHSIFCNECTWEIESAYGVPEPADCDDPLLNL